MTTSDLESATQTLVAEGKGILAADETIPTLTRRFDTLGSTRPRKTAARTARCSLHHQVPRSSSVASSCMMRPFVRRVPVAHRWSKLLRPRASFPASRSIPFLARRLPRGLTAYVTASRSTMPWAPDLRGGVPLYVSQRLFQAPLA
jgi:hypothetical protein